MLRIEVVSTAPDQLGEGPLWDVEEQALYWIDSYAREREAGMLFAVHGLGVRGLAEPRFAG